MQDLADEIRSRKIDIPWFEIKANGLISNGKHQHVIIQLWDPIFRDCKEHNMLRCIYWIVSCDHGGDTWILHLGRLHSIIHTCFANQIALHLSHSYRYHNTFCSLSHLIFHWHLQQSCGSVLPFLTFNRNHSSFPIKYYVTISNGFMSCFNFDCRGCTIKRTFKIINSYTYILARMSITIIFKMESWFLWREYEGLVDLTSIFVYN